MSDEMSISILGTDISVSESKINIQELLYNEDNPRVYSLLHSNNTESNISQEDIYDVMLDQLSVTKIKQTIYENQGLIDPILIRWDTKVVIEGNSRLTVYKFWNNKEPHNEKWQTIPCRVVSKLTEEQQDWYLSETHIKGKTPWSAYEKANPIYMRFEQGLPFDSIKKRFNINSDVEIRKRINTIQIMKDNNDAKLDNFSYYDVIERTGNIKESIEANAELKTILFEQIKNDDKDFTATHLREKLPTILKSKKHTKKFISRRNLDEAYEEAKTNNADAKLRLAVTKMKDVTKSEVNKLEIAEINKLKLTLKNITRECKRIEDMIKECKQ